MNTFNGVRAFYSYSQLCWTVDFLQNLLPWSVDILIILPIGMSQILIDMMFAHECDGRRHSAIIDTFKKISQTIAREPGALPRVVATVVCMACIAVAKASSFMSCA